MKLANVIPVALGIATLSVGGLVLTGHTAWVPTLPASELLASRTICASGEQCLDDRSVQTNGRWSRRTIEGTVATGKLWGRDRKALEAAAQNSPPPPPDDIQTCQNSTGRTITYRWNYQGHDVTVTQPLCAATPLPVELELEHLATKLD